MRATSTGVMLDDALRQIVGDAHIRQGEDTDQVDGIVPPFVVAPGRVEEAREVMVLAGQHGLAVTPRGAGTKIDWGNPPSALDVVLETGRLNRVITHEAGDLVVVAQAGVTLDALQETVGWAGQMLGIDSVRPEATLGGVVATNSAGPRRLRYGSVRDLLIGITVILPDGTVARSGGRVVKNVAGYDLGKLFTGSFGTLGLIVETTFRLHATPRARTLVVIDPNSPQSVGECLQALLNSALVPSAIDLEWQGGAGHMLVLFEGIEAGCAGQAEDAVRLTDRFGSTRIAGDDECDDILGFLARHPWTGDEIGIKIVTLPAELAPLLVAIDDVNRADGVSARVTGQAATSVLWVALSGDLGAVIRVIRDLRRRVDAAGGALTIIQAPLELKRSLDVWGDAGDALPVMRRIKERFDPLGTMSPGRFVGGI